MRDCLVYSEFPSEQSTDVLLQFFSSNPGPQDIGNQRKDDQNSIPSDDGNFVSKMSGCSWGKRKIASGVEDGNPTDNKKKLIHRDIERQRRQGMTTLYASLRSFLPIEYLKGKRSTSDHMHEAVRYIKHLQTRITELSDKRDELKRTSNFQTPSPMLEAADLPDCSNDSVLVSACSVGMEVAMNTGFKRGFPLSKLLDVVIAQGLSVVNCVSARVNERMLHTIVLKVNAGRSIELSELQQMLTELIVHSPC